MHHSALCSSLGLLVHENRVVNGPSLSPDSDNDDKMKHDDEKR
jgi:hypothetical protein